MDIPSPFFIYIIILIKPFFFLFSFFLFLTDETGFIDIFDIYTTSAHLPRGSSRIVLFISFCMSLKRMRLDQSSTLKGGHTSCLTIKWLLSQLLPLDSTAAESMS